MTAPLKTGAMTDASHAPTEYAMPTAITSAVIPASLTTPLKATGATAAAAPTAPAAHELIERPPEHTLARGVHEATPGVIWTVVAVGALVLMLYALYRVRRGQRDRLHALAAATAAFRRSGRRAGPRSGGSTA